MKITNRFILVYLILIIAIVFYSCDNSTSSKSDIDSTFYNQEMMETENPSEYSTCSVCGGSGQANGCKSCDNNGWQRCPRCKGSRDDGYGNWGCESCFSSGKIDCTSCNGAGKNHLSRCTTCNGTGETTFMDCPTCDNGKISTEKLGPMDCWICGGKGKLEYHP